MFVRIVETDLKPETEKEARATLSEQVLAILRDQPGFVDEITLLSDETPHHLVALSFWNRREDAVRYHTNHFEEVTALLRPYIESTPTVRTFNVEESTVHQIAAGKAA